ncbi:UNVERIFIED_CONTAM: hypothetical protein PYX00_007692 [Menopon gallinae]|uniref:C2H2-type domain-containing protein n=1 Tax=Menopon gallinae TaxID=328185 RepID=A0AAW2HLA3_9NEOP
MSIKNMYNEVKPVLINECDFDSPIDNILDSNKMENIKTESSSTTNIVVTKYADPSTDILDVEPSLELDQKGKIIQVELLPSSRLQNIQNKNLATLLNKSVIRKISKRKVDGSENKTSSDTDDKKFELCTVCGKEMVKNHELFCKPDSEFSDRLNSSESLVCSKCGKQFSSVYILKKHILSCRMHSISSPLCSKCGKHFSSNYNLKRHMTSCKLCPDDEKSPRYMCQCGRTYSQEWDMKKHKLKCKEGKKKCKHCLISSCNLLFYHKAQLIAHMKKDHNVKIQDPEILNFSCFEDFLSWKEREEEETYTYYSKQTGSNVSGVSVNTYYVCQHDGSDRTHTSTPRKTGRRNKKGRMKTGRLCWSQMNVKQFKDGTVKVTYFPSHTHPLSIADTEHHPLPPSVTMEIKRQLSELKAESDDILTDENQEVKKRKRQYGMTLRTLRALARKNRSLFRITAEAVQQKTEGNKTEMLEDKSSIQFPGKHTSPENNNFMQLLVTDEENVDDPDEMQCQEDNKQDPVLEKKNLALKESLDNLNELKTILESNKLDISMINQIRESLKTLITKCKSTDEDIVMESQKPGEIQDVMMYQPQSPLPTTEIFPLQNEENASSTELNTDMKRLVSTPEKTVYQIIAVDSEEKPSNEYLYQNAVELVGAREFIIIAGDHAQYFQSVDPDVQYDLS